MLTLLHGDSQVASRRQLNILIDKAKQQGVRDIIRLEGVSTSLTDLIQATETVSFFGTEKLVIVENLFSRPKSKLKDELIHRLKNVSPDSISIILWEPKLLTASQLKMLPNFQNQIFKISKVLFKFLESLSPGNSKSSLNFLHLALLQEESEMIFAMLIRQVRMLIQAQDNALKLPGWQLSKFKHQASAYTKPQLLKLHRQLLQLDQAQKTGQTLLSVADTLDIIIANL